MTRTSPKIEEASQRNAWTPRRDAWMDEYVSVLQDDPNRALRDRIDPDEDNSPHVLVDLAAAMRDLHELARENTAEPQKRRGGRRRAKRRS